MTDLQRYITPTRTRPRVVDAPDLIELTGKLAVHGTLAELAAAIRAARASGRLAHESDIVPTAEPGKFIVHLTLTPPVQEWARPAPGPSRRVGTPAAVIGLSVAVAVGLLAGWLIVAAVALLWQIAAAVAGVAVLAAFLYVAIGRAGGDDCTVVHIRRR